MHGDGTELHTMVSEADGEFSFTKIPPGSYLVIVDAKGFAPFTSPEFDVTVLQTYEVPNVSLSVATANIEVMVRPTDLILHAHANAGSSRLQFSVELLRFSIAVIQSSFTTLTGLFNQNAIC
jgi:hypothetical protein